MKKVLLVCSLALLSLIPASAQFSWGIRGGLNLVNNDITAVDKEAALNKDNYTGFFFGPMAELQIPVIGLGIDASLLYSQKGLELAEGEDMKNQSLSIPVSLKYTFGLGNLIGIFGQVGPQFDYKLGDLSKTIKTANETGDAEAREKVHHAATIAGMAFANAFLGVCHSMAHKLGAAFHVPHGIANALLICQVIRYNSNDCPAKQATFPQYRYPNTKAAYAAFARGIGLSGATDDEAVDNLINALQEMKKALNIPMSIKDWGIDEKAWEEAMKTLPELAFDDQCTGANPRYPLFKEIEQMYRYAYEGVTDFKL